MMKLKLNQQGLIPAIAQDANTGQESDPAG